MMRVGLREANQRFSSLIKAVKGGKEVILPDRGKPVARWMPIVTDSTEDRIKRMEETGLLIPARKRGPMPPFKGYRLRGKAIVDTIEKCATKRTDGAAMSVL
jgi:prevent-host-death family protein